MVIVIGVELLGMMLLDRALSTNLYPRGMASALPLWRLWIMLDGACLGAL